jgi:signal recognition particle subunit SRP54
MKRQEVIICSMTKKERANHLIIGPSRRTRIARGSGTSVSEVARLLKQFDKLRTMVKKVAKMSRSQQGVQKMTAMFGGGGKTAGRR